tara:strand:- start:329 stop:688 length:360 start_codon:yes stop_codon:yes gene_type:complete
MKIETKDEIVLAVLHKMDNRSLVGQEKYGATMMQEIVGQEKDLSRFLIDVQEELMDALLYIEAAKRCLADEVEEAMLERINVEYDKVSPSSAHAFEEDDERMKIIAQNGNTGEHYEKTI